MAKMLSKVAPWLTSAKAGEPAADAAGGAQAPGAGGPDRTPGAADVPPGGPAAAPSRGAVPRGAASGTSIRPLADADTADLWSLVSADPVANVFLAAHLETAGTAGPTPSGARILGCFDGGTLTAACWAGVNVVPVGLDAVQGAHMGTFLAHANRHISSIFGPAEGVLGIWSTLQHSSAEPFDVRPDQPLMELRGAPAVEPEGSLRFSTLEDLDALVPACVAMFEEEVGYSPLTGGGQHYRLRVKSLIERGHSLLARDGDGEVVFKAELGNVSAAAVQIQGVWMNPAHRGLGRAAAYMAAVVELSRRYAPVASLYVNDYNHRAMAAYRRVGFEQVGTFATILF